MFQLINRKYLTEASAQPWTNDQLNLTLHNLNHGMSQAVHHHTRWFEACVYHTQSTRLSLTEFLLVGATPGWRDVLPIAVDPPSKANRWEPIPTWEELALLNDTFDRRAKDEIGAAVLYLYEEDYDALGENVTLHAVPRSLLRAGRHPDLARTLPERRRHVGTRGRS